jgi:hypothetical protein
MRWLALILVVALCISVLAIPAHAVQGAGAYVYSIQGLTVKNNGGTTVYTGSNANDAIQWALNHLTTGRQIKQEVYLVGSFTLNAPIVLSSYTILEVASGGTLTMANGITGFMLTASNKNNIDILGGEWNGNRAGRAASSDNLMFYFLSCIHMTISNLEMHDSPNDNIDCEACSQVIVSFVHGHDSNNNGCAMNFCSNCVVENNHFEDLGSGSYFYCEDDGIVQHIDYNIIRGNLVERTVQTGLSISLRGMEDTGIGNVLENNTCIDCGTDGGHTGINLGWSDAGGIRMAQSCLVQYNDISETGSYPGGMGGGINCVARNSIVTQNTVTDIVDMAIYVSGNNNTISYNTLSGVTTVFYPGIEIEDGDCNQIVHNSISDCPSGVGIYATLTAGSNYNHINSNAFNTIAQYGIVIHNAGDTGTVVDGNTFVSSPTIDDSGTGTIYSSSLLTGFRVNGVHIMLDGRVTWTTYSGVDETTALIFAVYAYCNGHTADWGKNMNFPFATTSSSVAQLTVNNLTQLWYAYFWFCDYYNMRIVRIGVADAWGSQIMYEAWLNHRGAFFQVLDEMTKQASIRGIYIELVLSGTQGYPAYNYGGTGDVWTHSHAAGTAYQNMYLYQKDVIQHFNSSAYNRAIFAFDAFNEPDHNIMDTNYWHGDMAKFSAWATNMASDLCPQSPHIVDMGVADGGYLFTFGQTNFNLATGNTGFDICHRHYYASNTDHNNFDQPHSWANDAGKPLLWGEIGNTANYPPVRYTYAETRISYNRDAAWISMVMIGTSGYPYTGAYPIGENNTPPPIISPSISISASRTNGIKPLDVQFISSVINGQAPFTYSWSFGDGNTSTQAFPLHVYPNAGNYTAFCQVSGGGTGTSNAVLIHVSNPADPPPPPPPAPTIIINADHLSGSRSLTVHFQSVVANGQAPYTYNWVFGDGSASTSANPTHIYVTIGTFHAHASVYGGGSGNSNTLTITVLPPSTNDPNGTLIIVDPIPPSPSPVPGTNTTSVWNFMGAITVFFPVLLLMVLMMAVIKKD